MITLRAHFDGKVLMPDESVDLPIGQPLELRVSPLRPEADHLDRLYLLLSERHPSGQRDVTARHNEHQQPITNRDPNDRPLLRLAEALDKLLAEPESPTDGAAQHDHYLYGLPKKL